MLAANCHLEIGRIVSGLIEAPTVHDRFTSAIAEAKAILSRDPTKLAASVTLPLDLFGADLPESLQSCRLSVMRAGTAYHIERHPNAIQYVLSLENDGEIRVRTGRSWIASHLVSGSTSPIETKWHTVPANTWHQPTPGAKDWAVVAFHTVPPTELQDDYNYTE